MCRADYYYQKLGGSKSRTTISLSVGQNLQGGTSESAALTYLRKKHPGYEIILMKLEWK